MTRNDILSCSKFEDAIAVASYPVDLHHPKDNGWTLSDSPSEMAFAVAHELASVRPAATQIARRPVDEKTGTLWRKQESKSLGRSALTLRRNSRLASAR